MKGLEKYLDKYGTHFTEELAVRAIHCRWKPSIILSSSEEQVYYNVVEATPGDIIYLVNYIYSITGNSRIKCIRKALELIGDIRTKDIFFILWIMNISNFDFENYL